MAIYHYYHKLLLFCWSALTKAPQGTAQHKVDFLQSNYSADIAQDVCHKNALTKAPQGTAPHNVDFLQRVAILANIAQDICHKNVFSLSLPKWP